MASVTPEMKEAYKAKNLSAFVLGWTGEVGKELVNELLNSKLYSQVFLIGRRNVTFDPSDIRSGAEQRVVDFDNLQEHRDAFQDIQVGFCCLGTTRGKSGAEGFYLVDHDYVVSAAMIAKNGGCKDFHLVSSQCANSKSMVLYTKTKGEVEEDVKNVGFEQFTIYRPGILMCEREENRPGEKIMRTVLNPVAKFFPTAITTPTSAVAKAMVNMAVAKSTEKVRILENKDVHIAAGEINPE